MYFPTVTVGVGFTAGVSDGVKVTPAPAGTNTAVGVMVSSRWSTILVNAFVPATTPTSWAVGYLLRSQ